MIHFENTLEIHLPIEQVFQFVTEFENIPKWNYYVMSVRQTSDGVKNVGTIYHQIRKEDAQDFQITDYEPYHRAAVRTTDGSKPAFTRTFNFEAFNSSTRLVDTWELETGYNRIIEVLGKGRVQSGVAENLGKLKELLETGETHLQDGRVSKL